MTEITNSMKREDAPVKDSEVLANGSNDNEINRRYDKPRNRICPSMMTHKNQEVEQVGRKFAKYLINSRMGVRPSVK